MAAQELSRAPSDESAPLAPAFPSSVDCDSSLERGSERFDALERAAAGIRPSWEPRLVASLPKAALVSSSLHSRAEPRASTEAELSADITLPTRPLLGVRLADLSVLAPVAFARQWLSVRPWAVVTSVTVFSLLLATVLWPSEPSARAGEARKSDPHHQPRARPEPSASVLRSRAEPRASTPAPVESAPTPVEVEAAQASEAQVPAELAPAAIANEAPAAPTKRLAARPMKRREKRTAPLPGKPAPGAKAPQPSPTRKPVEPIGSKPR